jgi:hypothetical protein
MHRERMISRIPERSFAEPVSSEKSRDCCPLFLETTSNYSVRVDVTREAIEELRPVWSNWALSLDADIDYFLHQLTQDSENLHPFLITVYNCGTPQAMLIGKVKIKQASAVVSFVNIKGPCGRILEISKGGRIGQPSAAVDSLLAKELIATCRSRKVDSISFERLPMESELFRQIQKLGGLLVRERVPNISNYSTLVLKVEGTNPLDIFSGKIRREIRRKTRIVDRDFPGQVQLRCFSEIDELDVAMCDAMRIAVTTWQHALGLGLIDTARTRETLRFQARRKWLRIYVLYLKGAPCAFLVGQLYESTFYCQYAGFHPNYAQYSVGSLLTARVFEELALAGVKLIDLGEGGQEHNRRLGCKLSEEGTVHLFSDSARGIWLNAFFGITHVVRVSGERIRATLKLGRLGKVWRHYHFWRSRSTSEISEGSYKKLSDSEKAQAVVSRLNY